MIIPLVSYLPRWLCVLLCFAVCGIGLASNAQATQPAENSQRISLNFQQIDVRAALQIIAQRTQQNMVISDKVRGTITLNLNDVSPAQALHTILRLQGLSGETIDDVYFVTPNADRILQKREQYQMQHVGTVALPVEQAIIRLQYARAADIEKLIEDNSNKTGKNGDISNDGLLSSRGRISFDRRTNTLVVNDIPSNLEKVKQLVAQLDVPVKQVRINARIVTASRSFARELGIRWNTNFRLKIGENNYSNKMPLSANPSLSERLGVSTAQLNKNSQLGLGVLGMDILLDLELSAMQDEGLGQVISSPSVIAQDGHEAVIEQGTEIAYRSTDDSGKTTTTWKNIPLSLRVLPVIAPNNQVNMTIAVTKNSPGQILTNGLSIDSSRVNTQVMVGNQQTIVIGGIYEAITTNAENKIPLLGDLPVVGSAFRHTQQAKVTRELLIFITPEIVASPTE